MSHLVLRSRKSWNLCTNGRVVHRFQDADAASFKRMRPTLLLITKLRRIPHLCSIILRGIIARRLQSKGISFSDNNSLFCSKWQNLCVKEVGCVLILWAKIRWWVMKLWNLMSVRWKTQKTRICHSPKNGTSLICHLTNVHPTYDEISEELRVHNIDNDDRSNGILQSVFFKIFLQMNPWVTIWKIVCHLKSAIWNCRKGSFPGITLVYESKG